MLITCNEVSIEVDTATDCVELQHNLETLRTAPCTGSKALGLYDELLRSTLCTTLNVDLSDGAWQQASLPVRWGGLGVRSAVMLGTICLLGINRFTTTLVLKLFAIIPAPHPRPVHSGRPCCLAVCRGAYNHSSGG